MIETPKQRKHRSTHFKMGWNDRVANHVYRVFRNAGGSLVLNLPASENTFLSTWDHAAMTAYVDGWDDACRCIAALEITDQPTTIDLQLSLDELLDLVASGSIEGFALDLFAIWVAKADEEDYDASARRIIAKFTAREDPVDAGLVLALFKEDKVRFWWTKRAQDAAA